MGLTLGQAIIAGFCVPIALLAGLFLYGAAGDVIVGIRRHFHHD